MTEFVSFQPSVQQRSESSINPQLPSALHEMSSVVLSPVPSYPCSYSLYCGGRLPHHSVSCVSKARYFMDQADGAPFNFCTSLQNKHEPCWEDDMGEAY